MELYEKRDRLKQIGDTGLTRAQQRVDSVIAAHARRDLAEREQLAKSRHLAL